MAKLYISDDYLTTKPEPISVVIDKKIALLYDFCLLVQGKDGSDDDYEAPLRSILKEYPTEHSITMAIHDIIMERISIEEFIAQGIKEGRNLNAEGIGA